MQDCYILENAQGEVLKRGYSVGMMWLWLLENDYWSKHPGEQLLLREEYESDLQMIVDEHTTAGEMKSLHDMFGRMY